MEQTILERLSTHVPLTEIDIHFARFMSNLAKNDSPELQLAAALASHATGEGHICINLSSAAAKIWETSTDGNGPVTPSDPEQWSKKLLSSGVVGRPGQYFPLILDDQLRLYLYRYWDYEKKLADDLRARSYAETDRIDIPLFRETLSRLFPERDIHGINWQRLAGFVSLAKKFCVISGGPGTGKSTVIAKILALYLKLNMANRMRFALVAPTGKAAARLQQAINNIKETLPVEKDVKEKIIPETSTIHRLLGVIPGSPYFRHNSENLLPLDLVVIDEASMVDLPLMSKFVQAIPPDARLILLGDKDQLASVEPGAVLGDICGAEDSACFSKKIIGTYQKVTGDGSALSQSMGNSAGISDCIIHLKKSYRFGTESGIGKLSKAIRHRNAEKALTLLKSGEYDDIRWKTLPSPKGLGKQLREIVLKRYKDYLKTPDPEEALRLFDRFRILCAIKMGPYGVFSLNRIVEHILGEEGLIHTGGRWYKGQPILITRNDYALELFNGDTGLILPDPAVDNELRAFFLSPDNTARKFLPMRLPEHETVYAMTVHKSQGSEFDKALFVMPDRESPVLTRELVYTAVTRARENVEVWGHDDVFLKAVSQGIERISGLHDALWKT